MTVNDPTALRAPKVVAYFPSNERMAYLVMEFIDAATPADDAHEKVADTLQWLRYWLRRARPPPTIQKLRGASALFRATRL